MIQKSAVWLLDLIFSALMFVGIYALIVMIFDVLLSPVVFILTGELESVVSKAIINCFYFVEETLPLRQSLSNVSSATGLKGVDLMTTHFWEWQQSFYGRLKIVLIGLLGAGYFWILRDATSKDSDLFEALYTLLSLYLVWPLLLTSLTLPLMLLKYGATLLLGVNI